MSLSTPPASPAQIAPDARPARKPVLSLDLWAVVLSLALALAVKLGVIHSVAW